MSLAWSTILIIAFLLPGVFFFIGLSSRERFAKEIVRSGAVGEVGLAIFFALVIHLSFEWVFGINFVQFFGPIIDAADTDHAAAIKAAFEKLPACLLYVIASALTGLLLGSFVGWLILKGPLRFLATHRWVYDVIKNNSSDSGFVTAFVMTTTTINDRVVMYKGKLAEFYLTSDGQFAYVTLQNSSKFSMTIEDAKLVTSEQLPLFEAKQPEASGLWNYLKIDGSNISNILFERTPSVVSTKEGEETLRKALEAAQLYRQHQLEELRNRQIRQRQRLENIRRDRGLNSNKNKDTE